MSIAYQNKKTGVQVLSDEKRVHIELPEPMALHRDDVKKDVLTGLYEQYQRSGEEHVGLALAAVYVHLRNQRPGKPIAHVLGDHSLFTQIDRHAWQYESQGRLNGVEVTHSTKKREYSLDDALEEKPYKHRAKAGSIFQVLTFGITSNNFKNRLRKQARDDPQAEEQLRYICSIRVKRASYQGKDSICLWDRDTPTVQGDITYLIDPSIKVYGGEGDQRIATGYGHGIPIRTVEGGYEVGNEKAYSSEVLAAHQIPPERIRCIVIGKHYSILVGISMFQHELLMEYSQAKIRDPKHAPEDLLATPRLLARVTNNQVLERECDQFEKKIYQQLIVLN